MRDSLRLLMERAERLFLDTLDDLRDRTVSNDDYTILGASGLIRKLFLDDAPLVDQVNRKHKLKLLFEVAEGLPPGEAPPMFYSVLYTIDPEMLPLPKRLRTVDLLPGFPPFRM